MATVDIWNLEHEKVGTLELPEEIFGEATREDLISDAARAQMARIRKGSASVKTRGEVSGSGAKPFKQKRTGRARQGPIRAPHMRGGGVAFGPQVRSYSPRLTKKLRRKAFRSQLSTQARTEKLFVIKDFEIPEIKTKAMAEVINRFGIKKCMMVDVKENNKLRLSVRNLPHSCFRSVDGLNLLDLLRYDVLMISEASVKQLEGVLKS